MTDVRPRPAPTRKPRPLPVAVLVGARPKQWLKNVLVFVAPGAAGVLTQRDELVATVRPFLSERA